MGAMSISSAFGNQNGLKLQQSLKGTQLNEIVEPENQATFIQNLIGYPASVERYRNKDSNNFEFEDPSTVDPNALQPTSGRKLWKLRHGKKIRKPLKADKSGFIGGS